MKLNNKGITLIELIISFALLMVIILGMLTMIVNIRNTNNEKNFQKAMLEFKTTMTERIQKDLIQYGFASFENCDAIENTVCKIIVFKDEEQQAKELRINLTDMTVKYGTIVYDLPKKEFIEFKTNTSPVEIKTTDSDTYLVISIPYFEIDQDKNYGINIIHPINLVFE